jgi:hypothetical protein
MSDGPVSKRHPEASASGPKNSDLARPPVSSFFSRMVTS